MPEFESYQLLQVGVADIVFSFSTVFAVRSKVVRSIVAHDYPIFVFFDCLVNFISRVVPSCVGRHDVEELLKLLFFGLRLQHFGVVRCLRCLSRCIGWCLDVWSPSFLSSYALLVFESKFSLSAAFFGEIVRTKNGTTYCNAFIATARGNKHTAWIKAQLACQTTIQNRILCHPAREAQSLCACCCFQCRD